MIITGDVTNCNFVVISVDLFEKWYEFGKTDWVQRAGISGIYY